MNSCEWKARRSKDLITMTSCEVTVCTGGSCVNRGARGILDAMEKELQIRPGRTTPDGRFSLETTNCLDRCSQAASVAFDEKIYSQLSARDAVGILKGYRREG